MSRSAAERWLTFVATAILLGIAPAAGALDPGKAISQYVEDVWTTDQGLPQNAVNAIAQTPDGYLWIATDQGLARFDGVRFTQLRNGNAPGGIGPSSALLADRAGALWIGTRGRGLLRLEGSDLRTYTRANGLHEGSIRALSEGASGGLWIGMVSGGGLTLLRNGRFTRLTTKDGLSSDSVLSLFRDRRGRLWIGTDKGLDLMENEGTLRLVHYTAAEGLGAGCVLAIREDKAGTIWVGTKEGDPDSLVNPGTLSMLEDGRFTSIEAPVGMSALLEDRHGLLWVGTLGGGLRRLKDGALVGSAEQDVLSRTAVHALFEDREGSLWIGTEPHGLRRLRDGAFRTLGREEGLTDEGVDALFQDRGGAVWLGSRGGVSRLKDAAFTRFTSQDGLPGQRVAAICEDSGGTVWLGTGAGLVRFAGERPRTFSSDSGAAANSVNALWPDPDGGLWVGTWGAGAFRFADDRFTSLSQETGRAASYVTALRRTRDGSLWIGTTGATSRLARGTLTNATVEEGVPGHVEALYEDHEGYLWIGTKTSGLYRYRDAKLAHIGREEGLFDDQIGTIGEDGEGNFWMSCSRGAFRASRRDLQDVAAGRARSLVCVAYGTADGMRTRECGVGQGQLRTRDGRIWFATSRGAAVVDPASMPVNPVPPPIVIEGATVDDRRQPLAALRFPGGRSALRLQYSGLSLLVPDRVRYRYRLEPHDADWVDAGARREAAYNDLPSGRYTFRVTAANNDGVWSRNEAKLALEVLPRFWQTIWFRSVSALGLIGIGFLAYRRRISQLEEEKAAQERFTRRLMEQQEQERKRIASELHDSLGQSLVIIKNRAREAQATVGDPDGTREHLAEITESAAAALAEVRQIAYDLRPFLVERLGLTKAIEALIQSVRDASGLSIAARLDGVDGRLPPADEIGFYRIVQEVLRNIVEHAGATAVDVALTCDEDAIQLTIRDDGGGFTPGAARTATGKGGGFGLIGMAERAKILGAILDIRSEPGQGATIGLRVRRIAHGK